MTAHELARYLLACEDLPVMMNGWGSDAGQELNITGAAKDNDVIILGYEDEHGEWALSFPRLNHALEV